MCGDERTWAEALLSEKRIGWAGRRSGRVRPTLKADPKLKYATVHQLSHCYHSSLYFICLCPEPKVLVAMELAVNILRLSASACSSLLTLQLDPGEHELSSIAQVCIICSPRDCLTGATSHVIRTR